MELRVRLDVPSEQLQNWYLCSDRIPTTHYYCFLKVNPPLELDLNSSLLETQTGDFCTEEKCAY